MYPMIDRGKTASIYVYYSSKWNFSYRTSLAPTDFVWSSSNPAIATVDARGCVTPRAAGTFRLTAKLNRAPGYTVSKTITVVDPASEDYYW